MSVIYIRMRNRVHVKVHQKIRIKDIAKLIGPKEDTFAIGETLMLTVKEEDKNLIVIDLAQLILCIRKVNPQIELETFGPSQTIIEVIYPKKKGSFLSFMAIWLLLFIGGGVTIMNYHVDVGMAEVHQKIFQMITGREDPKPLLVQVPYSFGLGIGMVLFFNHFFKKRFNEEPSPLEVEMFNYQQDLDQYVIMKENEESVRHLDDR